MNANLFARLLQMSLTIAEFDTANITRIVTVASGHWDTTTMTLPEIQNVVDQIVQHAHRVRIANAPAPLIAHTVANVRLGDEDILAILRPAVRSGIDACLPVSDQSTTVASWGITLQQMILNPEAIITSQKTCVNVRKIGTEFRTKTPLTFAAIAHGPITRPATNAVAAAIKWTVDQYATRLVRQYLYKVCEGALQNARAHNSSIPAVLLNSVLSGLGETTYITSDIPITNTTSANPTPKSANGKRPRNAVIEK